MSIPQRIVIPKRVKQKLLDKSLGVCCVCKERGIGINFHHIDGNPVNNDENNIAVLCVKEHDCHHRPNLYNTTKHLELGADEISNYKDKWEQTVEECKSDNPKVFGVINAYGDILNIHSVKFLLQDVEGNVIFERLYHRHYGNFDNWTDWIIDEVDWLGKNVKLTIIDKPLDVELCPCCKKSFSTFVDKSAAIRITACDWQEKSIGTIYINPTFPSFGLTFFYGDQILYKAQAHICEGRHLHLLCDNLEERIPILTSSKVKEQATELKDAIFDAWKPGQTFIGTGDPDNPTLIDEFKLPNIWKIKNYR